jgi:hypothetical protein
MSALASRLAALDGVTELDLSYADLGEPEMHMLAAAMQCPSWRVTSLDLSGNPEIGTLGFEALAVALLSAPAATLTELHLDNTRLKDSNFAFLAEALAEAPALAGLRVLNLFDNLLTPANAAQLAGSMLHLAHLHTCLLGRNGIGDEGLAAFAALLVDPGRRVPLAVLDVEDNDITDLGFAHFFRTLAAGPPCPLEKFYMRGQAFLHDAVLALAQFLALGPPLAHLALSNVRWDAALVHSLAAAIAAGDRPFALYCDACVIPDDGAACFAAWLPHMFALSNLWLRPRTDEHPSAWAYSALAAAFQANLSIENGDVLGINVDDHARAGRNVAFRAARHALLAVLLSRSSLLSSELWDYFALDFLPDMCY